MKVRMLATSAIAAAALAISVSAPAFATAPAKPSGSLTIYTHQTQRDALDLGATGTSVGDVATGSGTVALTKGGKDVGTYVYRSETMRVTIPGGNESRLSTSVHSLPGGTIMVSGLVSIQQGTRPTTPSPQVIVGGTGDYAGANGTATFTPGKNNNAKVTFTFTS